jgi:hypothetical protein
VPDDLIFSDINIPDRVECGNKNLRGVYDKSLSLCTENQIPDLSKLTVGALGTTIDPNVSDTYLQSVTNLYNTKLNKDSEILASYIRCKEESYKPIINQFRDNATVITSFVSENQDSINRILNSGKIESTLDKIDEFPLESITPIISEVSENITPTISKVTEINDDVSTIKETINDPLIKWPIIIALVIIAFFLIINIGFMIKMMIQPTPVIMGGWAEKSDIK